MVHVSGTLPKELVESTQVVVGTVANTTEHNLLVHKGLSYEDTTKLTILWIVCNCMTSEFLFCSELPSV